MTAAPGRPKPVAAGPTADEIAAVLAALVRREAGAATSGYERWRHARLAVRLWSRQDGDPPPRR